MRKFLKKILLEDRYCGIDVLVFGLSIGVMEKYGFAYGFMAWAFYILLIHKVFLEKEF